ERARAEENFQLALDAVDQLHRRVSEERLLYEPGLQPLRKELLETARSFYLRFIERRRDDPAVRLDLGRALYCLATVPPALGSSRDELGQVQEALALQEQLAAERPDDPRLALDLVRTQQGLGILYGALGQRDLAEAAYQAGQALSQRHLDAHPDDDRALDLLY